MEERDCIIIFSLTDWGLLILNGGDSLWHQLGKPLALLRNFDFAPLRALDQLHGVVRDGVRGRFFFPERGVRAPDLRNMLYDGFRLRLFTRRFRLRYKGLATQECGFVRTRGFGIVLVSIVAHNE